MRGAKNKMENIYEKLRRASNEYELRNEEDKTKEILKYIKESIKENKKEIEELIKIYERKTSYEKIEKIITEKIEEYDITSKYGEYKDLEIDKKNGYLEAKIKQSKGIIAVEAYEDEKVIEWAIEAVISRNAVIIADAEYNEKDEKNLVIYIIKDALEKYGISKDLIMEYPYEEVNYEKVDEVIYIYEREGKKIIKEEKEEKREKEKKTYIYINTKKLEERARKDNEIKEEVEIIEGKIEEVIEKINKKRVECAVIYTESKDEAYKFLTLVKAENVFVNASIINTKKIEEKEEKLYYYKNIIVPMKEERISKEENKEKEKEENSLTINVSKEKNIFSKILKALEKILKK